MQSVSQIPTVLVNAYRLHVVRDKVTTGYGQDFSAFFIFLIQELIIGEESVQHNTGPLQMIQRDSLKPVNKCILAEERNVMIVH